MVVQKKSIYKYSPPPQKKVDLALKTRGRGPVLLQFFEPHALPSKATPVIILFQ